MNAYITAGGFTMYWDNTIIFGLATVALVIAFMVGWVGFVIRDHLRKNDRKK
ncbi:cytochrome c oxidase subunit CcoM [Halomonas campaniensis]|uniref:cytochrome c oxidase subunit CcoM n=1 Tax=Halomonas campaniensis TaxID=213554 RepID=UPI001482904E|nr:cytochrome c oxidase subunit CcoM [Halomonas campaniensis]